MIPIGHVFTPLRLNNNIIIDNDIIIAFFLLLVNANCTLALQKHSLTNPVSEKDTRSLRKTERLYQSALVQPTTVIPGQILLRLDSDTFYINHVTAVMVDNLRRLLLGINLSDKAIMDFDFPGVGFPV